MKKLTVSKEIYNGKAGRIYFTDKDVCVWDVEIDAGLGEEITIGHISDIHFNKCNEKDFNEANPYVMGSYENRKWLRDGASVPLLHNALELIDDVDQTVFNGDTLDYLTNGSFEIMEKEVWNKIPGVIATVAGHDMAPYKMPYEERINRVKSYWKHDIYYETRLLKNKLLVIGYFNDAALCNEYQVERFRADLESARKNGYSILLFAHEPLRTNNPDEMIFTSDKILLVGDASGIPEDFCNGRCMLGNDSCDETSKEMYRLITENADIIKASFAGHYHNNIYTEILAKTASGEDRIIPQYIHTASCYNKGAVMRILIK